MVVSLKPQASPGGIVEHEFFASVPGSSVIEIDIMDADPIGPALPILKNVKVRRVGVSFLHDAAPEGGTWTLTLEKRISGTDVFIPQATFGFGK